MVQAETVGMGPLRRPTLFLGRTSHFANRNDGGGGGHPRRMLVARVFLVAALAVAAPVALTARLAGAAGLTVVVDDTSDLLDASVGDGACRTSLGTCTLRAAIQETNTRPGADTIIVPSGIYALAIPPLNQNVAD